MRLPLAIDLFCGLGGWTEGLLAEGYYVVGFDNERHEYWMPEASAEGSASEKNTGGSWFVPPPGRKCAVKNNPDGRQVPKDAPRTQLVKYPGQLVLQDVLTLHGSQFKDAALIVASPPCQEYSYMAMPWSRAKAIAAEYRSGVRDIAKLTALFDACFRIQREASEAAGHRIPLVVENVRGAIPWVGRSRWNYGSYHLWGDVPALMPMTVVRRMKSAIDCAPRRFDERIASTPEEAHRLHYRLPDDAEKTTGHINKRDGYSHTRHLTNQAESDGVKVSGDWFGCYAEQKAAGTISPGRLHGKHSTARKAASAQIAKIPLPLARHIARTFMPRDNDRYVERTMALLPTAPEHERAGSA